MRWDCTKRGCFNKKMRPKIELFSDCFPGKINFGDVDGLVEINGKGLGLEWKTKNAPFSDGQLIAHEKLSQDGKMSFLHVVGDAESMVTDKYRWVFRGKLSRWRKGDFAQVKDSVCKWVKWAIGLGEGGPI